LNLGKLEPFTGWELRGFSVLC